MLMLAFMLPSPSKICLPGAGALQVFNKAMVRTVEEALERAAKALSLTDVVHMWEFPTIMGLNL